MCYATLIKACVCSNAIEKALPEIRKKYGNIFYNDVFHTIGINKLSEEEDKSRKGRSFIDGSVIDDLSRKIIKLYEESLKSKL